MEDPNDKPAEIVEPIDAEVEEDDEEEDESADGALAPKKFRNALFFFPPVVLDSINKEIDEGWRGPHVHHMLQTKWHTHIPRVPSRPTVDKYVKWYLAEKKKESEETLGGLEASAVEIHKSLERIIDPSLPVLDKKSILEALIRKCGQRIQTLERWQRTTISPQFENSLARYFAEVRQLVETLAKLNNELEPDQKIIVNVVDAKIQPLFQAFYAVLKELCPDKLEHAKIRLREEIRKSLPGGEG